MQFSTAHIAFSSKEQRYNGSWGNCRDRPNWFYRDHPGTLLQDYPYYSTPQILSQLDDLSGCGIALDWWNVSEYVHGIWYIKSCERKVP